MKYVRIVNESVHNLAFCLSPRMPVTAFVFLPLAGLPQTPSVMFRERLRNRWIKISLAISN